MNQIIQFYLKKKKKKEKKKDNNTTTTITIKMPANFNEPMSINYCKVHQLASPTFENEKEVCFSPWRYGAQY